MLTSFWYGGAASMVASMVTHPLDLAKAQMQAASKPGATMIGTLVHTARTNGLLAVYDGLSAALLRQATYSTARLGVYEYLKTKATGPSGEIPPVYVLLPISMFSGLVGSIVGNPADVINVRMQNDRRLPHADRRNYKHALDGIYRIIKTEGVGALSRGIGPNSIRGILMTASQVVSYDTGKTFLVHRCHMDPHAQTTFFAASIWAGFIATTVCSPVDVIKTRAMNSTAKISPLQVMRESVAREGIQFLFRGWTPAFIRLAPQTIVTFVVLEQLKKWGGFS